MKLTRALVLRFIKCRTESHFWTSHYYFQYHQLPAAPHPNPSNFFIYLSSKLTSRRAIHKTKVASVNGRPLVLKIKFVLLSTWQLSRGTLLNRVTFLIPVPNDHSFVRDSKGEKRVGENDVGTKGLRFQC